MVDMLVRGQLQARYSHRQTQNRGRIDGSEEEEEEGILVECGCYERGRATNYVIGATRGVVLPGGVAIGQAVEIQAVSILS